MADKVRVFVSHHHSPDEDTFTARLVADLEAAGADVWVDTAGISSGSFVAKISEGLEGRQWLVLVMTPAALASPWVRREVEAALSEHAAGRMLGVIPFVMQPCEERDLPILWRPLHRYDSTRDYGAALSGLLGALGLTAPVAGRAQPAPPVRPATPAIPPDRFPPRLAQLGYSARVINGIEVILPPMCDVAAGEFLMGSDKSNDTRAEDDELPQQTIWLPRFQIAKYPLTLAEHSCFVGTTRLGALDYPVTDVSWHDAVAYAVWLSKVTGEPWKLPSEAQWEKAARGTDGRIYPWGNQFDASCANIGMDSKNNTTPVGSYPSGASPCGAQDMSGNVWEWTGSRYKAYPYTTGDDREELDSSESRVMRGGSSFNNYWVGRAAFRTREDPSRASNMIGFRLVRG